MSSPNHIEPERLDAIAKELARIPGILGIFPGVRRRDGLLADESAAVVHVKRKRHVARLPAEHRIPKTVAGVPIDVVAVGRPRVHAEVDANDHFVENFDPWRRRSAVSALAQDASGAVLGLGSGHGLLPVAGGAFQSGAFGSDPSKGVFVDSDPADTAGVLSFGAISPSVDFAISSFSTLEPPVALLGHNLSPLPIPVRAGSVVLNEAVQHEAPGRGRVTGVVTGGIVQSPIALGTGLGFDVAYADVFTVAGSFGTFSLEGDSGSIVFDGSRRALGFIVGGGKDPSNANLTVTYVLRNFSALQAQMGSFYSLFFGNS